MDRAAAVPAAHGRRGSPQGPRFPFTFPTPGSPANKTLDYSVYLPISFSPGYDIHNRLPYAEHYDLSFQRELSKSTVLTLSYVGTQGHRLISQYDANPGNAALCVQLNALGAVDLTTQGPGNVPRGDGLAMNGFREQQEENDGDEAQPSSQTADG